jgi:hypothetical protein
LTTHFVVKAGTVEPQSPDSAEVSETPAPTKNPSQNRNPSRNAVLFSRFKAVENALQQGTTLQAAEKPLLEHAL